MSHPTTPPEPSKQPDPKLRPKPAGPPPATVKQPATRHWLRESLREMLVLVIGILLSIWISNLFQDYKDDERAAVYLTRINKDLADDLSEIEGEHMHRQRQLVSARKIISALNETDQSGLYQVLFEGFQQLLWTTSFTPKDATFRSLESTGDLRLIQNDSVVNGLLSLYRGSYSSLDANNTDITKYRDNFLLPYVIENVSFRQAFNPQFYGAEHKVTNREELYNHLIYEQISLQSTVESYQRNIEMVKQLRALIGRELEH